MEKTESEKMEFKNTPTGLAYLAIRDACRRHHESCRNCPLHVESMDAYGKPKSPCLAMPPEGLPPASWADPPKRDAAKPVEKERKTAKNRKEPYTYFEITVTTEDSGKPLRLLLKTKNDCGEPLAGISESEALYMSSFLHPEIRSSEDPKITGIRLITRAEAEREYMAVLYTAPIHGPNFTFYQKPDTDTPS